MKPKESKPMKSKQSNRRPTGGRPSAWLRIEIDPKSKTTLKSVCESVEAWDAQTSPGALTLRLSPKVMCRLVESHLNIYSRVNEVVPAGPHSAARGARSK